MERILGVNTWVWTSPLTDASLKEVAAHVASLGFDAIELPLEHLGDWDAAAAREILAHHTLTPVIIGTMPPGRSLVDASPQEIWPRRTTCAESWMRRRPSARRLSPARSMQ